MKLLLKINVTNETGEMNAKIIIHISIFKGTCCVRRKFVTKRYFVCVNVFTVLFLNLNLHLSNK